jgi:DNA polymerase-4
LEALRQLAQKVGQRLRSRKLSGRTITLKVRFASFTTITRSHTYQQPLAYDEDLFQAAQELLQKASSPEGVRLLGLTAGQLEPLAQQGSLFMEEDQRKEALYQTLDTLRERFGEQALCRGTRPKKHGKVRNTE